MVPGKHRAGRSQGKGHGRIHTRWEHRFHGLRVWGSQMITHRESGIDLPPTHSLALVPGAGGVPFAPPVRGDLLPTVSWEGAQEAAIEVKATDRVRPQHLAGLRAIKEEHPSVGPRILVCLEGTPRQLDDGILVLPALVFLKRLWAGEIL